MEERYYSFPEYCKRTFGRRLYRAALDAGMSCPNRDGTIGTGGCVFCSAGGSGEFAVPYRGQRLTQADLTWFHGTASDGDFIAYFQSFTNTYAPLERLEFLFERALSDPLFAGISIATRPDCVSEEVLELLILLKRRHPDKFIWLELGLQTASDRTASLIRRGYRTEVYIKCAESLHRAGIPFIVHVIIGLPGEGEAELLDTIRCVNETGAAGVKLQLLHYLKGTELGNWYKAEQESCYDGPALNVLTEAEYIDSLVMCIRELRSDIVIHRLTGDGSREELLAPEWSVHKKHVLNALRHRLKEADIRQGSRAAERRNSRGGM